MVHVNVVSEFVHHDQLNHLEVDPAASMSLQHKFDDFAVVEVTTDEFSVKGRSAYYVQDGKFALNWT